MSVTILVVDDEPDIVDLFKRRFRKELKAGDYAMIFAASGEEALTKLKEGVQPEVMLILSDINMPGMNGLELLQNSKKTWPDLPVMMITAYGDVDNRTKAEELGATEFLTKPLNFDDLKSKIGELLAAARRV